MKNKEVVSRISNGFKALNKDTRMSKRYILQVATDKAIFLMSQKFRDRSLFRESNLFMDVPCFEMELVDTYTCDIVAFRTCHTVMKSKEKLPKLIYSRYGSSLKEVTNIDFSVAFKPTTITKYRKDKKRQCFDNDLFSYIKNDYLYLPDSDVEMVSLSLYSPNTYEVNKVSSCKKGECENPWDFEFSCSTKILEVVIQETIKELGFRMQISEDENPNLDENIKSKTTN